MSNSNDYKNTGVYEKMEMLSLQHPETSLVKEIVDCGLEAVHSSFEVDTYHQKIDKLCDDVADVKIMMKNKVSINTPTIISIEGNIGSGKSRFLNSLKNTYKNDRSVVFIDEPVSDWNTIQDENGIAMIEKFYGNQKKYSFAFQMMAYISRLANLKTAIGKNPGCVFITERCLHTDRYVFAKMLYDQKNMEQVEYQIYLKWFDHFVDIYKVTNIVYIKTSPEVCDYRIKKRSRTGEDSIPLEYLIDCDKYHENMMQQIKKPILCFDGNVNHDTNPSLVMSWVEQVEKLWKYTKCDTRNGKDNDSFEEAITDE